MLCFEMSGKWLSEVVRDMTTCLTIHESDSCNQDTDRHAVMQTGAAHVAAMTE